MSESPRKPGDQLPADREPIDRRAGESATPEPADVQRPERGPDPDNPAPQGSDPQGVEREDTRASDSTGAAKVGGDSVPSSRATDADILRAEVDSTHDEIAAHQGDAEVMEVRHGMFGVHGTGDTSGYGRLVRAVEFPAARTRPYARTEQDPRWWDDVADRIDAVVPQSSQVITSVVVEHGEITFHVARAQLRELVSHLRDDPQLRFEFCSSVSGVHYPADAGAELHVVYHLQSMTHNRRIRLEVSAPDADPHIPSVVSVYPTADWHERETWDMFGIQFDDHPALTRILMPDDWPGHPQRKDYPLGGIPVEFKGATIAPPDERRNYS